MEQRDWMQRRRVHMHSNTKFAGFDTTEFHLRIVHHRMIPFPQSQVEIGSPFEPNHHRQSRTVTLGCRQIPTAAWFAPCGHGDWETLRFRISKDLT